MPRHVNLATIQPPSPDDVLRNSDMIEFALDMTDEAGRRGSDIALLPELINIYEVEGQQLPLER